MKPKKTQAREVLRRALSHWEQALKQGVNSIDGSEMAEWFVETFAPAAKAVLRGGTHGR